MTGFSEILLPFLSSSESNSLQITEEIHCLLKRQGMRQEIMADGRSWGLALRTLTIPFGPHLPVAQFSPQVPYLSNSHSAASAILFSFFCPHNLQEPRTLAAGIASLPQDGTITWTLPPLRFYPPAQLGSGIHELVFQRKHCSMALFSDCFGPTFWSSDIVWSSHLFIIRPCCLSIPTL